MPPVSPSSFIPKRNANSRPKSARRYNFFILGAISYSLFIAAPLASAALFIYQIRAESKLNESIANLEEQIKSFNEADLARVVEFNNRLVLGKKLLDSHVSYVTLLGLLESSTAETVQFNDLAIERTDTNTVKVKAALTTDALDGALFQRVSYNNNTAIAAAKLSNVTLVAPVAAEESEKKTTTASDTTVALQAEFTFSADEILYAPLASDVIPVTPPAASQPVATSSTATASSTNPL